MRAGTPDSLGKKIKGADRQILLTQIAEGIKALEDRISETSRATTSENTPKEPIVVDPIAEALGITPENTNSLVPEEPILDVGIKDVAPE
jgi:hypothetical protein